MSLDSQLQLEDRSNSEFAMAYETPVETKPNLTGTDLKYSIGSAMIPLFGVQMGARIVAKLTNNQYLTDYLNNPDFRLVVVSVAGGVIVGVGTGAFARWNLYRNSHSQKNQW